MAQNAPTNTSEFAAFLSPDQAAPYFEQARRNSVVQSLARQVPLGINGAEVPITTSKATAGWVSEGGRKPSTSAGLGVKSIKPHKIAAISVVSAEVVRANPGNYMEILRGDITEAIAKAFDDAVLHGTNTPFDQHLGQATKTVDLGTATAADGGVYSDLVDSLRELKNDQQRCHRQGGHKGQREIVPAFEGVRFQSVSHCFLRKISFDICVGWFIIEVQRAALPNAKAVLTL